MRSILLLSLLLPAGPQLALASDLEQLVRVRLEKQVPELTLVGAGVHFPGQTRAREALDPLRMSRWKIRFDTGVRGWRVTEVDGPGGQSRVLGGRLEIRGDMLRSSLKVYPSRLTLIAKDGGFDIIGELNMREYLAGVVGHEMPASWPIETLRAQAVSARSYALAVKDERRSRLFDVESTVDDQVFEHTVEKSRMQDRVRSAVIGTDDVVIKTPQGKVLKAFFHADCGGHTASARDVWGTGPDMGTAVDDSCPANPRAQWHFKISTDDLSQRLGKAMKALRVVGLSLLPEDQGGRITRVKVETPVGATVVNANDFRLAVGPGELRSTRFAMVRRGDQIEFVGRGFGHGVGLCQWGSKALGERGWDAKKILAHYYPKAVINL